MSTSSTRVVGIAWYRQESYEPIVALMADGASFPKTYASWRQKAVRMERELKRQGLEAGACRRRSGRLPALVRRPGRGAGFGGRNRFVEEAAARQAVGNG